MVDTKEDVLTCSLKLEKSLLDRVVQAQAKSLIFNRSEYIRKAVIELTDKILNNNTGG